MPRSRAASRAVSSLENCEGISNGILRQMRQARKELKAGIKEAERS